MSKAGCGQTGRSRRRDSPQDSITAAVSAPPAAARAAFRGAERSGDVGRTRDQPMREDGDREADEWL